MKSGLVIATLAAFAIVGPTAPADAAGCIKGALAGGVAGHYAGGHSVLGAVGGCVVGRRLANNKAARDREAQSQVQQSPTAYDGTTSRDPASRQMQGDPRYSGTASVPRDDSGNVGSSYNGGAYRR